MKYIISGRDVRITEVKENEDVYELRRKANRRPRNNEGRFVSAKDTAKKLHSAPAWMKFLLLAKPVK